MPSLEDRLTAEGTRSRVARACCELVARQVQTKRGLAGVGIKTALKLVTAVRPRFVEDVVSRLLPEFGRALEPYYARSIADGAAEQSIVADRFRAALVASPAATADVLLRVTDRRVDTAAPAVRKAYARLRSSAQRHVEAAVPDLAATLADFV